MGFSDLVLCSPLRFPRNLQVGKGDYQKCRCYNDCDEERLLKRK